MGRTVRREELWRTETVTSNDDFLSTRACQAFQDTIEQTISSAFKRLLETAVHLNALASRVREAGDVQIHQPEFGIIQNGETGKMSKNNSNYHLRLHIFRVRALVCDNNAFVGGVVGDVVYEMQRIRVLPEHRQCFTNIMG